MITPDGRFVAFGSEATNLVPGDTNGVLDVFLLDRSTGVIEMISTSFLGGATDGWSSVPRISADGNRICFRSSATNLVPGDTNGQNDIFVFDRQSGITQRINVDSSGGQSSQRAGGQGIASSGRFAIFVSDADDLVPGDTNQEQDVFVRDLQSGTTERISIDSQGNQANGSSSFPSISADGRFIAFSSRADNLDIRDTNGFGDVFVRDRLLGTTELVSLTASGVEGNQGATEPCISANGSKLAFISLSDTFWWADSNLLYDAFVVDRATGELDLVSQNSGGMISNGNTFCLSISADGLHVAFEANGDNLVPGDTNGASDVFVRSLPGIVTERVTVDSFGVEANDGGFQATLSGDGRLVVFASIADNLVPFDTNNRRDIFLHDRWDGMGANAIFLTGPSTVQVGTPFSFSWQTPRPFSDTWLLASADRGGSQIGGHMMDVGSSRSLVDTGFTDVVGMGGYSAPPAPAALAGAIVFFELLLQDRRGVLFDSNVVDVAFQ
ncbi:MAG: TolB family protein [Planctomycetota bacterium]|jgi:Tol biopolymer transport system component